MILICVNICSIDKKKKKACFLFGLSAVESKIERLKNRLQAEHNFLFFFFLLYDPGVDLKEALPDFIFSLPILTT